MNVDKTNTNEWNKHVKRLEKLAEERKHILALEGRAAFDAILDHPQPNALVHSFAEEDLVFLIHEIGPADALDLISMASDRQWEYIIDIESWQKDRINFNAVTRWMSLMMEATPQRFVRWAATEKPNLLEYFLFYSIEIIIREHDQDPSEFGDGFITYDDTFYFRIPDTKYAPDANPAFKKQHRELLTRMMDIMANMDHVFFQQTLLRAAAVIPAESEEEAFRLRNFRLAEKGFVPFHEAVGVFQPISIDYLKKRKKTLREKPEPDTFVPAPINQTSMMGDDSIFSRTLAKITDLNLLQQLQVEFAGVCNQLIEAEQKPVHSRDELKTIVKKACGYISIALESLICLDKIDPDVISTKYVQTYPLIDLFRAGYGEVAGLQHQAKSWQQNSWFSKNELSLNFWGERLVGVIGGLLITRPKFYDNYQTGHLYREFETGADIEKTQAILSEAMAYDTLLADMAIPVENFPSGFFITYENLLMTLWARHVIGITPEIAPIPLALFKPFFKDLWETKKMAPAITDSKKYEFLQWLSTASGRPKKLISQDLGNAFESLFNTIAEDYGMIQQEDIDPRFVSIFLLSPN